MSSNGTDGKTGSLTVNDHGENLVDEKIKKQVLELRSVVDDDERRIYVDRLRTDPQYTRAEANQDWGVSVRQYLRAIKRLWPDEEDVPIAKEDYYWKRVPLSQNEYLYPHDKNGFRFSLVQHTERFATERDLRNAIGLGPRGDIPEPYSITFKGLSSILNQNRIEHTWLITTHKQGPPPAHNIETVEQSMPIPKHILENAVEAADNFLQQAGLGFDVSMPAYEGEGGPGL